MSLLGVLRGPRQVLFGSGQRHALGAVVSALGSRALVCTDARFGSTPEFAQLVRSQKPGTVLLLRIQVGEGRMLRALTLPEK